MTDSRLCMGRRTFLGTVGAGLAFPMIVPARVLGRGGDPPPSERVRVGFIGVGNQGKNNLKALMAHAVAVCDVDGSRLGAAKEGVEKAAGRPCAAFGDYRAMLDCKDVDAVVVTTPDHWHALATIDACRAGKDVYCEKPLTLTVAEGTVMVATAREHGRIVQTGSQQRSDARFRRACEAVRSGKIGRVRTVRVGLPAVNFDGPPVPDSPPPPGLDFDFWLGPAPDRPYNAKRVHYNFRFFWDYSGGQLTNFGAHHLDIAQWGLGRDESGPVSIEGRARFHQDGWYEVPESSTVTYRYDDGVRVVCEQGEGRGGAIAFEGEGGTIRVDRGHLTSDPAEILAGPPGPDDVHLDQSDDHHLNWLECIKTRSRPICDVAIGHRSATVCHLGNIALRLGRPIRWDPVAEAIVDDPEASLMLARPYRTPWSLG